MQPLGTKVYLLKRYRPSDSFCTFLSESVCWTKILCFGVTVLEDIRWRGNDRQWTQS